MKHSVSECDQRSDGVTGQLIVGHRRGSARGVAESVTQDQASRGEISKSWRHCSRTDLRAERDGDV